MFKRVYAVLVIFAAIVLALPAVALSIEKADKDAILQELSGFVDKNPDILRNVIFQMADDYSRQNKVDEAIALYEKGLKDWDTPFTPAVGLVLGLDKALSLIEAEGLETVFKRCSDNAAWTREKLKGIGLGLFSKAPSSTVTAAKVPEGVDGEKLIKVMRDDKGVGMAGGQGSMKGQIVRICHMGAITRHDLEDGIQVLQQTLKVCHL